MNRTGSVIMFALMALLLLFTGPLNATELRTGDRGAEVKEAQQKLTDLGYDLGLVDGIYGRKTRDAVRRFQSDYDLPVSGVIDERTWRSLMAAQPSEEEIPDDRTADDEGASQTDEYDFDSEFSFDDFGGFDDMEMDGGFNIDLGGHIKTANAIRFQGGDKRFPQLAETNVFTYYDSLEGTDVFSLQQNKVHLFLDTRYSDNWSSYAAFDFYATPAPDRPFDDELEFEIDELYLDFLSERIGLRLGKEKVVWGMMDMISPANIINSGDMIDPFVNSGLEDARGQWGIHFNYDNVGKIRLEALFVPIWNPSQMPNADIDSETGEMVADYWFPPLFSSIPWLLWTTVQYTDGTFGDIIIENDFLGTDEPDKDLSTATFAARMSAPVGRFDLGAYFITGLDPKPNPVIHTTVVSGVIDFGGQVGQRNVELALLNEIEQRYTRVWIWGGTGETVVGRFRFKGETALSYGRKFFPDITTQDGLVQLYQTAANNVNVYRGGREEGEKYLAWDFMLGSEYTIPGVDIITSFQMGLTQRFGYEEAYFGEGTSVDLTLYAQKSFADNQLTASWANLIETGSGSVYTSPRLKYVPQYLEFLEFNGGFNLFLGPGGEEWGEAFKTHESLLSSYGKYSHFFATAKLSFDVF